MSKAAKPYPLNAREIKSAALDKFVKKENATAQEKRMSKIARLKSQRLAREEAEAGGATEEGDAISKHSGKPEKKKKN